MPTEFRFSAETARLIAARNEALRRAAEHSGAARFNATGWQAESAAKARLAAKGRAVWPVSRSASAHAAPSRSHA